MCGWQEAYNGTEVYGLPNLPVASDKVRSFAALQQDADLLRNLRGHSLDTLTNMQRQLASMPLGQVGVALLPVKRAQVRSQSSSAKNVYSWTYKPG